MVESLLTILGRERPVAPNPVIAKMLLRAALRRNAPYFPVLRSYTQISSQVFISEDRHSQFDEQIAPAKGQVRHTWASLCTVKMDSWEPGKLMFITSSHATYKNAVDAVKGSFFLINTPQAFFEVFLLDPGNSRVAYDRLTPSQKSTFLSDFARFFCLRFGQHYKPNGDSFEAFYAIFSQAEKRFRIEGLTSGELSKIPT